MGKESKECDIHMTSITFHGGVGEIGGNAFLLDDGGTRLFLDFGKNYGKEKWYFDFPLLVPRKVDHFLNLNLVPNIPGLYHDVESTDAGKYQLDGIVISHPHTDHFDNIRLLRDDYPIYCGADTRAMILAREFSKTSSEQLGVIAKLTQTGGKEIRRTFNTIVPGRKATIGNIGLQLHPVDHSIRGAYGTIIETSRGTIVYTGDFRMHGPRASTTEAFLQKARSMEPDILLVEGTHVSESKVESEVDVREKIDKIVHITPRLVMVEFSIADMDRLGTILQVAKQNGRKLAISMKQAHFLKTLADEKIPLPFTLDDEAFLIFQREKQRMHKFENDLCDACPDKIIDAAGVKRSQDSIILATSFFDMNEIGSIKPAAGSAYILSSSEPFDEEMEINFDKLKHWLDFLGLPLYQSHASGHAPPHELKRAIETIRPKKVVPVHTTSPDLYKSFISNLGIPVEIPRQDGTMML